MSEPLYVAQDEACRRLARFARDATDAPLATIRQDVLWLLNRAFPREAPVDTSDGGDDAVSGVRWEVRQVGSLWFINGHTETVWNAVRIAVDVDRRFRADHQNDPDVEPVAHAIRDRLAILFETVGPEGADRLPDGSIIVKCDEHGVPEPGAIGLCTPKRHEYAGEQYRVLYRAPSPPAPLTVGSVLRDVDDLRRAGVGAWVRGANDGGHGIFCSGYEVGVGVSWSDGEWTSIDDIGSDLWPMTLCGLPDDTEETSR